MSSDFDTGFKEILGSIDDILTFLSLVDNNIIESDIENILFKAHYIEQFMTLLKRQHLSDAFERKLKEYLKIKKVPLIPTVPILEFYSDEVLSKILSLQLSNELTGIAVKLYIENASQMRFEELIKKLAKFKSLFIDVSQQLKDLLPSSEIESTLLIECWLKIINGGKEGLDAVQSLLKKMSVDPEGIQILLNILCLDSFEGYSIIQEMIVNILISDLCEDSNISSWKIVLQYGKLESIILKFPNLLSIVLRLLEIITNRSDYNEENENWKSTICADLDYNALIKIFDRFYRFEVTRYKLKKVIYLNKLKGNGIWEHVDKRCYHFSL